MCVVVGMYVIMYVYIHIYTNHFLLFCPKDGIYCVRGLLTVQGMKSLCNNYRDVDYCTIDGVTAVGGCWLLWSGGVIHASTVEASRCGDCCNGHVMCLPVTSGWKFSATGDMCFIRETCVTVSVDVSTRRKRYVFRAYASYNLVWT